MQTTSQYSAQYVAGLKLTIRHFFRTRHSGTGAGRKTGFRHAREMIRSQIRHLELHRKFHEQEKMMGLAYDSFITYGK